MTLHINMKNGKKLTQKKRMTINRYIRLTIMTLDTVLHKEHKHHEN